MFDAVFDEAEQRLKEQIDMADTPGLEVHITTAAPADAVNHPAYYGGADDPYEAIKVIEAWLLGFNLGNTVKYIRRAGKKHKIGALRDDNKATLEDLKKARWYLDREITNLEADGRAATAS